MKTNERIARGTYRLIIAAGIILGVVMIVAGSIDGTAGLAVLVGGGLGAGGYVLARVVAWIIRGFGSDE